MQRNPAFLVDGHAHIYPSFSLHMALQAATNALHDSHPNTPRVICLAEPAGCNVFEQLSRFPHLGDDGFMIRVDDGCLRVESVNSSPLCYLLPGRQVVTAENIEVLALNVKDDIPSGLPAVDTVKRAVDLGALPVLAWSPGKWFFKRKAVIERVLETFGPKEIAIGDTTLRPVGWSTPQLMRSALDAGYRVLCGSDPLPFPGEECRLGSYMTELCWDGPKLQPSELISGFLKNKQIDTRSVGSRGNIGSVASRIVRNAF